MRLNIPHIYRFHFEYLLIFKTCHVFSNDVVYSDYECIKSCHAGSSALSFLCQVKILLTHTTLLHILPSCKGEFSTIKKIQRKIGDCDVDRAGQAFYKIEGILDEA